MLWIDTSGHLFRFSSHNDFFKCFNLKTKQKNTFKCGKPVGFVFFPSCIEHLDAGGWKVYHIFSRLHCILFSEHVLRAIFLFMNTEDVDILSDTDEATEFYTLPLY